MRHINRIIIHCTATPEGREVTVADIDRWHRARGFSCIGYHYVIYLDGSVHPGRPLEQTGAHCSGHNTGSIGIAYVGGLAYPGGSTRAADTPHAAGPVPTDTRTPAQREALRRLTTDLLARFPGATLHGHSEFAAKACPCFDVATDM